MCFFVEIFAFVKVFHILFDAENAWVVFGKYQFFSKMQ